MVTKRGKLEIYSPMNFRFNIDKSRVRYRLTKDFVISIARLKEFMEYRIRFIGDGGRKRIITSYCCMNFCFDS